MLRYAIRALALLLTATVLVWHARETLTRFPPGFDEKDPLPFLQNDHPLHYYYSQITTDFFARNRSFWGYDPNFMAGYAKTMIFPTGCTLPELVAIVCGKNSVRAFRLFVASCVFLPPIFLGLAARMLAHRWSAAVTAFCMGVVWVWCWPARYVVWGMAPFVLTITASVLASSVLGCWLDTPSSAKLLAGGLIACLATIAHPCAPVVLTLMLSPAYIVKARMLSWRQHCAALLVPLCAVVLWLPWWGPSVRLRETFGTTTTGFVNENVLARFEELLNAQYPEETALLIAGLLAAASLFWCDALRSWVLIILAGAAFAATLGAGLGFWTIKLQGTWFQDFETLVGVVAALFALFLAVGWAKYREARAWLLVGGAAAFFLLTYIGGGIPLFWALQPGRYTQPLYATLIVLTSVGLIEAARRLAGGMNRPEFWPALGTLVITVATSSLMVPKVAFHLKNDRQPMLRADLPTQVSELVDFLHSHTDSSGRILFEDRGRLNLGPFDPFSGTNPSALLPLLAPGQYIGGPYLYTHSKSNFTQVGDGKFFGRDLRKQPIDLATFQRYAELYNVRWAVLRSPCPFTQQELIERGIPPLLVADWSTPALLDRLAQSHPDYFLAQARFGYLRFYELNRSSNWAIVGSAQVRAEPDRIEVTDARPDSSGKLILSYHWISTLHASVPLRPDYREDDPVPFIAIENPPARFVIENRAW